MMEFGSLRSLEDELQLLALLLPALDVAVAERLLLRDAQGAAALLEVGQAANEDLRGEHGADNFHQGDHLEVLGRAEEPGQEGVAALLEEVVQDGADGLARVVAADLDGDGDVVVALFEDFSDEQQDVRADDRAVDLEDLGLAPFGAVALAPDVEEEGVGDQQRDGVVHCAVLNLQLGQHFRPRLLLFGQLFCHLLCF
jgi:hypothetical protein